MSDIFKSDKKFYLVIGLGISGYWAAKFLNSIGKRVIILDIPLYLENRLNKKKDIVIFIQSSRKEALKRIKKRKNYNKLVLQRLKKLQLPLKRKKKKSHYVIKNNFDENFARKKVQNILDKIL